MITTFICAITGFWLGILIIYGSTRLAEYLFPLTISSVIWFPGKDNWLWSENFDAQTCISRANRCIYVMTADLRNCVFTIPFPKEINRWRLSEIQLRWSAQDDHTYTQIRLIDGRWTGGNLSLRDPFGQQMTDHYEDYRAKDYTMPFSMAHYIN